MVGMEVYGHPRQEQGSPNVNVGLCEPVGVIAFGRDVEDPPALHQGVERVEAHAHHDDAERHFRRAAHEQRKDERPLQVVGLKEREERQRPGFPRSFGEQPQHAHRHEYGRLHQHPADLVGHGRPVFGVEEIAVSGFEKMQGSEDHQGQQRHDDQEYIECLGHIGTVSVKRHKDNKTFPLRQVPEWAVFVLFDSRKTEQRPLLQGGFPGGKAGCRPSHFRPQKIAPGFLRR